MLQNIPNNHENVFDERYQKTSVDGAFATFLMVLKVLNMFSVVKKQQIV